MKAQLFLFNGLSILACLAWLGWTYVKALASAYGNANPSTGPGDLTILFMSVGLLTAACAAISFFVPAPIARFVALAPVVFVLLGQGYIGYRQDANRARYRKNQAAHRVTREALLSRISRDYVRQEDATEQFTEVKSSFLTHDRETSTLVLIDVGYQSEISAYGFGSINGESLDTAQPIDALKKHYGRYLDREGKSIFDRYTLRHKPELAEFDFRLEKYKP